jgi:hypothetical protein
MACTLISLAMPLLTLIHKYIIRSVRNSLKFLCKFIGQTDVKHIMTSLVKTITLALKASTEQTLSQISQLVLSPVVPSLSHSHFCKLLLSLFSAWSWMCMHGILHLASATMYTLLTTNNQSVSFPHACPLLSQPLYTLQESSSYL